MGSWKLEVVRMASYMVFPVALWYGFNTEYYQKNYFLPQLKELRPEVYKQLMIEDEEPVKKS